MCAGRPRGHGLEIKTKRFQNSNFEKFFGNIGSKIFARTYISRKICRCTYIQNFWQHRFENFCQNIHSKIFSDIYPKIFSIKSHPPKKINIPYSAKPKNHTIGIFYSLLTLTPAYTYIPNGGLSLLSFFFRKSSTWSFFMMNGRLNSLMWNG
jgi:hypothetical protein